MQVWIKRTPISGGMIKLNQIGMLQQMIALIQRWLLIVITQMISNKVDG